MLYFGTEDLHQIPPDPSITQAFKSLGILVVFYSHTHSVTTISFIDTLKVLLLSLLVFVIGLTPCENLLVPWGECYLAVRNGIQEDR